MKIFFIHNYYQQPGGEDQAFADESSMLEEHGHRIFRYTVHNDRIKEMNLLRLACCTLWNKNIAHELLGFIRKAKPDVIHFHNTFPLISPSSYYAMRVEGIPVVQSLHNYRLLCPNALFFRNGHVCEDCISKFLPFPGALHACYRESRVATTLAAAMLSLHRVLRTYIRMVDVYIALTEFARNKFIEGGLPPEKIAVKPNFLRSDSGTGNRKGGYAVFAGRLTLEKGITTLLLAWEKTSGKIPLKIIGNGPLSSQVAEASRCNSGVEWLGHKPRQFVLDLMKDAYMLIFPSVWYEGLPMTIIEAFSVGLPVIASYLGSISSIIDHKRTGLYFEANNPEDLAAKIEWAWTHSERMQEMGKNARNEFELKYTSEINYQLLMRIYRRAIEGHP